VDVLNDLFALTLLSILVYLFGSYDVNMSWYTLLGAMVGMFAFAGLGTVSFLHNSLVSMEEWAPATWVVYGIGFVLAVCVMVWQYYRLHVAHHGEAVYLVGLAIFTMILGVSFVIYWSAPDRDSLVYHPHHYQIFFGLSMFIRFNDRLSQMLGGVAIGILVQGISAYGPARLVDKIYGSAYGGITQCVNTTRV
jgi:hypothetical protein